MKRPKAAFRKAILILAAILPQGLKKIIYRYILRWKIGRNVQIGFSFIDSERVVIGDSARIGHFNAIRGLRSLEIGSGTYIANFNQFFGVNVYETYASRLTIGDHVNFMSHHFIDVAGTVSIGSHCTIGGRDTHVWSHSVYLVEGVRTMQPGHVHIGDDVYIGARATLVGCDIPAGAFVGAGSVVNKSFPAEESRLLIAGNPATIKKRYAPAEAKENTP